MTDASQLRKLVADLGEAGPQAVRAANLALQKAALDVEARAKTLAPVDTGALQNSISRDMVGTGNQARVEIGPTVEYGLYQELGTRRMAPQPYLGPALDAIEPGFVAAIESIGGRVLDG